MSVLHVQYPVSYLWGKEEKLIITDHPPQVRHNTPRPESYNYEMLLTEERSHAASIK